MTVAICYEAYKTCALNKVSSLDENFCKEWKNNLYPLDTESNKDEYNWYSSSDIKEASYYTDLNNKIFYPCHSLCKECKNIQSCNTCKDDYYF